eukprot:2688105-Pyramimonas_sp.AAC.1
MSSRSWLDTRERQPKQILLHLGEVRVAHCRASAPSPLSPSGPPAPRGPTRARVELEGREWLSHCHAHCCARAPDLSRRAPWAPCSPRPCESPR